jgi:hypothetical protein
MLNGRQAASQLAVLLYAQSLLVLLSKTDWAFGALRRRAARGAENVAGLFALAIHDAQHELRDGCSRLHAGILVPYVGARISRK